MLVISLNYSVIYSISHSLTNSFTHFFKNPNVQGVEVPRQFYWAGKKNIGGVKCKCITLRVDAP